MLFYERKGEGPDVVLVHGFMGSGKIFEPLTNRLINDFCVTTIDLPGFGGSYDQPVPSSVEALSELVAETVQSIGIKKCSMLGNSLGAWIALELSLQKPEWLKKTVLYGGSPDGPCPERFETYEDSIERLESEGIEQFSAELVAEWFRRGKYDPLYPFAREAGRHSNQEAAIAHIKTWNSWRTRDRIHNVSCPTLIVCGDSDRSTHPDLSIEMWQKIESAQLFILPDAGHIAHLEYDQAFYLVVSNFLSQSQS